MDFERMPLSPPQVVDGITLKFPAKLWRIVNNCRSGSISWQDGGETIRIHRKQFEAEYLSSSKYFKTTNFPSFIRQLNIYGFRKVPTTTRWQDCGTIFEYRHEYFVSGHPELLSEVKRNTAVRRTLREQSFKHVVPHVVSTQITCQEISRVHENSLLRRQKVHFKSDDCHPLLKTSTSIIKYPSGLESASQNPTKVYLKPHRSMSERSQGYSKEQGDASDLHHIYRKTLSDQEGSQVGRSRSGVSDMTQMSPRRLQDQVAGLMASINTGNMDDELMPAEQRNYYAVQYSGTQSCEETSPQVVPSTPQDKSRPGQILFLPNTLCDQSPFQLPASEDQLSQESAEFNKQLMFSCPIDREDEDELERSLDPSFGLACDDMDTDLLINHTTGKGLQITDTVLPCEELDSFPPNLCMTDTLAHFGDEQGFLTPAYYDPVTGTVTLLLPSLSPES